VGDNFSACLWGRNKVLCCTPNPDLSEFYCDASMCPVDPDLCTEDPFEWNGEEEDESEYWDPAPPWVAPPGDTGHDELRRREAESWEFPYHDYFAYLEDLADAELGPTGDEYPAPGDIVPRAGKKPPPKPKGRRSYRVQYYWDRNRVFDIVLRPYNGMKTQFTGPLGKTANRLVYRSVARQAR
jgi:hypothetical protein